MMKVFMVYLLRVGLLGDCVVPLTRTNMDTLCPKCKSFFKIFLK